MKKFIPLGIIANVAGFLEIIIVTYWRDVDLFANEYLPFAEQIRVATTIEATTIIVFVIIAIIAIIAGKNFLQRLAYFIYIFAIWDISYHICFKMFVDRPPSLLTHDIHDILFIILIDWLDPILFPLICSSSMIFIGISLIYFQERRGLSKIK